MIEEMTIKFGTKLKTTKASQKLQLYLYIYIYIFAQAMTNLTNLLKITNPIKFLFPTN